MTRPAFEPDKALGAAATIESGQSLLHKEITEAIIGAAIAVHHALGPGLLESAYEACLVHELTKRGLSVSRQIELPIHYDGVQIESGYRMDLVVEAKVLVELKAVDRLAAIHEAQLNTYMRLSKLRVGLLINFNSVRLRDGVIRRIL
jgi:GxxExxY protein